MEALTAYINNRQDLKEISGLMLEAANKLLSAKTEEVWFDTVSDSTANNQSGQLRLL